MLVDSKMSDQLLETDRFFVCNRYELFHEKKGRDYVRFYILTGEV